MKRVIKKRLGELLIEGGIITNEQLDQALAVHQKTGRLLGTILVEMGFAQESDVVSVIAAQYGIPYLPLKQHDADPAVLSMLPRESAQKYRCFPVDRAGSMMTVSMENPLDKRNVEGVEKVTGCKLLCFVATTTEINEAIREHYGKLDKERGEAPSPGGGEEGIKVFQVEENGSPEG